MDNIMKRTIPVLIFSVLIFSVLEGCITTEKNNTEINTSTTETPQTTPAKKEIAWIYDIDEAKQTAQKENKLILIDFNAAWCVWCKRMEEDTYTDGDVIDLVNKNFVPVYFNLDIEANKQIYLENYDKYVHGALPTILILDSEGKPLYRIVGYKSVGQFTNALTQILENEKK